MGETLKDILSRGPRFEENILLAFENRKLVFFVGAGVSRIMGIKGWGDFSAYLIKAAFPNYKDHNVILRDISDSKERITIAYKKFESENKLKDFYKLFGQGMVPDKGVFNSKENIYEILNRFDAIFLTTNADNLFEEVLGSPLCHENYEIAIIKSEIQRRQNHLFYLHGHYTSNIDIANNNLVFTAPQYVRRYNDPKFLDFLKAIFQEDNTIVFIGYGLNEFELIDYIITKSGYTPNVPQKVYVLYGLCENDDILFEAKTAYFNALNIKLIPYDISKKGYDSLIDVLKLLYDDYKKRAIVPVTETIADCIENYNDENYATIKRYLTIEDLAHANEIQITREIQKLGTFEWTKRFFDDGLLSSQQLGKKIEYRAWPLLELLLDWVRSGDKTAQHSATVFLDGIDQKQLSLLSNNHSFITSNIVQIILSLDKDKIKSKYIDMILKISKTGDLFGYNFDKASLFKQIPEWDVRIIRRLFDVLFYNADIDSFDDNNSYIVNLFFKHFNSLEWDKRIPKFIFRYFTNLIISNTNTPFNLFMHTNDLDHIYKNHKKYWKIILTQIKYVFSIMSVRQKNEIISGLIYGENDALWKLGIYLARKNDINVSNFLTNQNLLQSSCLYHEYYLLLINQKEHGYLTQEIEKKLCTLIWESKFGIDKYILNDKRDVEYFDNLILSKRLTFLQLLSVKEALSKAELLIGQNVNPYPAIEVAKDCDYVHSIKWETDVNISEETFKDTASEQWVDKLIEIHNNVSNDFNSCNYGREFVRLLLEQSEEQQRIIIPTLGKLPSRLLENVLYELRSKRNNLILKEVLIDTCLSILDDIVAKSPVDTTIAKTIFELLADINPKDESTVDKILVSVLPWLHLSIDGAATFIGDSHVLNNLINYGDFSKYSVLINCYIAKKKIKAENLLDENIELLLELLKNDNHNKTVRYTLCYHYQNLKHLSNEGALIIFNAIFDYEPFDMTALLLCCLNSDYLFKEIIEKINRYYLQGSHRISKECNDNILSDQFYSYIISARYHNMLSAQNFEEAYADSEFLNHYLRCISAWAEKDNFDFDSYLIPCWTYVKSNYDSENIRNFASLLIDTIDEVRFPTEDLLDMYIDIAEKYLEKYSVHLDLEKVLIFFDINKEKASKLIESILTFLGVVDIEKVEILISKYKEFNLNREARSLLNMLSTNGMISNKQKEHLAEMLT